MLLRVQLSKHVRDITFFFDATACFHRSLRRLYPTWVSISRVFDAAVAHWLLSARRRSEALQHAWVPFSTCGTGVSSRKSGWVGGGFGLIICWLCGLALLSPSDLHVNVMGLQQQIGSANGGTNQEVEEGQNPGAAGSAVVQWTEREAAGVTVVQVLLFSPPNTLWHMVACFLA